MSLCVCALQIYRLTTQRRIKRLSRKVVKEIRGRGGRESLVDGQSSSPSRSHSPLTTTTHLGGNHKVIRQILRELVKERQDEGIIILGCLPVAQLIVRPGVVAVGKADAHCVCAGEGGREGREGGREKEGGKESRGGRRERKGSVSPYTYKHHIYPPDMKNSSPIAAIALLLITHQKKPYLAARQTAYWRPCSIDTHSPPAPPPPLV